jgi:hypothetical protein
MADVDLRSKDKLAFRKLVLAVGIIAVATVTVLLISLG